MRETLILTKSICRLLTLLLILPLCSVQAIPRFLSSFNNTPSENVQRSFGKQSSMEYTVWNYCSKHYLRIRGPGRKGVDARGDRGADDTTLIFEVRGADGLLSIRGKESRLYLCMSKKGRLRARHRYTEDCGFIRIIDDKYDQFQLSINRRWYIGFRKMRRNKPRSMGKPLPAYKRLPNSRLAPCYKFIASLKNGYTTTPSAVNTPPVVFPSDFDPEPETAIRHTFRHNHKQHEHRHSKKRRKNGRRRRRGRRRQKANVKR